MFKKQGLLKQFERFETIKTPQDKICGDLLRIVEDEFLNSLNPVSRT